MVYALFFYALYSIHRIFSSLPPAGHSSGCLVTQQDEHGQAHVHQVVGSHDLVQGVAGHRGHKLRHIEYSLFLSKFSVCTKRDCFRAPAHLDCLNFDFPSSMLPKIRCYYKCPYHRGKEQVSLFVLGDMGSKDPTSERDEICQKIVTPIFSRLSANLNLMS